MTRYQVYPIYTRHAFVASNAGCLDFTNMNVFTSAEVMYPDVARAWVQSTKVDPGGYLLIEEHGSGNNGGGVVFSVNDQRDISFGMGSPSTPAIANVTKWPPKGYTP